MSTTSIKKTLLQEVNELSPAHYSAVLDFIGTLKTGKGKRFPKIGSEKGNTPMTDDSSDPMEEFGDGVEGEDFWEPQNIVPQPGCLRGKIWMADDFDAPLEEFEEYM